MRVLQLIDSLHPGGAEKMAINLFKELNNSGIECFICTTRQEGLLKSEIIDFSKYLFLKKRNSIDVKALRSLYLFIKSKKINIIHAHGTSYFTAFLIKFAFSKKVTLIWHDHYGNSEFLEHRPYKILRFCSKWFDGVVCVNNVLLTWCKSKLLASKYLMINNFVSLPEGKVDSLQLNGSQSFKLICIANLRPQKNHHFLLNVFNEIVDHYEISLHLFGKDFYDAYSEEIKKKVDEMSNVYYYGSQKITKAILKQANVGLLVSKSEGLPLALLEYGMAGLPVICTVVGECREVIGNFGLLIPSDDEKALNIAIKTYFTDENMRNEHSNRLKDHIFNRFGAQKNIGEFIDFYEQCS
ncbi:glycosyltransferase family 4 protein [Zunongwangia pacifica]|uniref:Glycosyltransferase family 4 protein n=1 Tax=Zunongwangia pacifica TaxID=2911062 RepID=A0A9X1ZU00_9FLAO|nr:glycosyltransferase family 4 protein [Zunongwangia pacifica]MCL6219160.1 glycosyltransferase family 4 protein [Zunongwangia pacifica]